MEGAGQGYAPPRVRDYGDLVALTRADATMLHVGIGAGANTSSTPLTPGGGGGGQTQGKTTPGGSLGDTLPASGNGGGGPTDTTAPGGTLGASGGGGSGGGGSGGSGGGGSSLPFTGFYVAVVGALGSGLTAAGVALRRRLSRGQSPD